ncbi:ABC transporter ATP-binding protein [Spirochaeta lutea]|uniref:ABC transporter ATP-binding protein n=1 Tax=Spirochaeta lutea TaxID=1480694 RepID=UPI0009DD3CDA|nr:ABC transporter ATP-binding protein [Spirochaeta lutea]
MNSFPGRDENSREGAPQGDPILALEGISFSYPGLPVLEDVSLSVRRGEVVSILGPSGCGKSTLLSVAAGLDAPPRGRVFLDGRDCTGKPGGVSYMQQEDLLLPWRRVGGNIALPLTLGGMSRAQAHQAVEELLPAFGLEGFARAYPFQLSGGMRQRAALMRSYMASSRLMLLDEPFARLDALTRASLHQWFLDLVHRLGTSLLIVTHDIDEALYLSDRIIVLSARPARVVREMDVPDREGRSLHGLTKPDFTRRKQQLLDALGQD